MNNVISSAVDQWTRIIQALLLRDMVRDLPARASLAYEYTRDRENLREFCRRAAKHRFK